ncbi:perivitellin-2 67 kDa subunit-like [Pomacea canaliculata]|uniref:perivitellin-2 67 kDa subunit-like n=1 Tax=Pomacea canaliculata TaxID=400727 RepID=UPI000D72D001|nr:perivitellin-2 67 kDa subunit-like [Pomacea canaliculata]
MSQLRWSLVSQLLVLIVVCCLSHSVEAKVCSKVVPGLDKLRSGVDLTKLDLLPLSEFGDNGFRSAVVDYTCDSGETKIVDGETYEVPDQMDSVTIESSGQQSSNAQIIKSESQIKDALAVSVGVGVETGKVGFSASSSYAKMQESITKRNRAVTQVSAMYSTCSGSLSPNVKLGQSALTQLNKLPTTFAANPSGYFDFISTYGTHFFNKGRLGGMFVFRSETDMSYFQSKTDEQVEANVKATFVSVLSVQTGVKTDKSKEVSEFEEASSITSKFYGGKTNLAAGGLSAWQPTVAKVPYFMSGTLRTISSLITDPARKAAMELAVKNYFLQAKAADLDRMTYIRLNSWTDGQTELNNLLTQTTNLKKKTVFTDADEKLLQSIEDQVRVPEWFSERGTFCFKSLAAGSPDQCNGQAASNLCAEPNRYTQRYWDKTYLGDTGCKLGWKISASESPDWFKSVKVNFRWYSVWSPCACGPVGTPFTLSASAGSWTQDYLDVTNSKYGECMMQWRIEVPQTAPVWARNINFCVDITCNNVKECVQANRWTQPYLDVSDRGACGMSWGLKIN